MYFSLVLFYSPKPRSLCKDAPLPLEKIGERDSLPDFFSGEGGVCTQPISLVAKYEFYYFEIGVLPMGLLSHKTIFGLWDNIAF